MTAEWQAPPFRLCTPLIATLLSCVLLVGCASLGWHDVSPHYDSAHRSRRYQFDEVAQQSNRNHVILFNSIFGTRDGSQLWAVGNQGTILHYAARTGRWELQPCGTSNALTSISGTGDGAQLWTVGDQGTILHYTAQTGRWERQDSGTNHSLTSVFATSDGVL